MHISRSDPSPGYGVTACASGGKGGTNCGKDKGECAATVICGFDPGDFGAIFCVNSNDLNATDFL
jgi:hypothetical protein